MQPLEPCHTAELSLPLSRQLVSVLRDPPGAWSLVRETDRWLIQGGRPSTPDATVTIAADDVWRMFYNALSGDALVKRVTLAGNADLAAPLLPARSVIV